MLHPVKNDDGPSFRVLLFYFFLLSTFSGAQTSELICSHQPIAALAGDDVILPCRLKPAVSVSTVEWSRPDLDPKDIHVYEDGRSMLQNQNPSYRYRTKLFTSELKNGNVSLKILRVKMSDKGKYQCVLPSNKEAFIELNVGAVSTPTIELLSNDSLSLVLSCKSKGWYPEPEVLWLDGEGNLLSAGSTETIRGPDDLYTVSSTVTVEKRRSNRFTCRVQQKNINQTRETHFDVPDDKPPDTLMSVSTILYIVLLLLVLVLLAVGVFFINKRRRTKDPVIRLEIFLIVTIIVLLLLLVLLVFFIAISVSERLEHTNAPFNLLEMLMIVSIILVIILLLVLFAVAVFIMKKLEDTTDPVKRLDIFLIVSMAVVVLFLLAFVVIGVKEMGRTYGQFIILQIIWIVITINNLLIPLRDAVRNVKKPRGEYDAFIRLQKILNDSYSLRLPLLYLVPFSIAVSVTERLRYNTDPLSPLEIFVIVSIFLLPIFLYILLDDAKSKVVKRRRAIKKRIRQLRRRPKNNQAASNDTPPEQSALVDPSTTDSSTKKPTETPGTKRIQQLLSRLRGRQAARTETNEGDQNSPQDHQAASNDTPPEQIALVDRSTADSSTKKPTETPSGGN